MLTRVPEAKPASTRNPAATGQLEALYGHVDKVELLVGLLAEAHGEGAVLGELMQLMVGVDAFTPIINPPEVAILGVGRITDVPAPAAGGGVAWRKSMTLSLTIDHRAVDGAPAARFLGAVAGRLEGPAGLL